MAEERCARADSEERCKALYNEMQENKEFRAKISILGEKAFAELRGLLSPVNGNNKAEEAAGSGKAEAPAGSENKEYTGPADAENPGDAAGEDPPKPEDGGRENTGGTKFRKAGTDNGEKRKEEDIKLWLGSG
ncbi:MAG: hypothetical protein IJ899_07890 [Blautia sp.]|nr:hypothetical protein [Blautia sp.]